MRRTILLGALLACAVAAQASVRSDIERQYKRWAKAAITNDVDTVLSILAPNYTLKTYTGTVIPHDKYEASLRKRKAENKPATAYKTKIASVTVNGPQAKVISDETSEAQSQDPITNKKVTLLHIHRYLDTWMRMGKTWRLESTVTQTESTIVKPEKA